MRPTWRGFWMFLLTGVLLATVSMTAAATGGSAVSVQVNGQAIAFDVPPVIENGRTLVPLRAILEALGATLDWYGETGTITASLGETTVVLRIGDVVAKVNGGDVTLDVPARIIDGRTLVPLRFVSEAFGAAVGWDGAARLVTIDLGVKRAAVDPQPFGEYGAPVYTSWYYAGATTTGEPLAKNGMTYQQQSPPVVNSPFRLRLDWRMVKSLLNQREGGQLPSQFTARFKGLFDIPTTDRQKIVVSHHGGLRIRVDDRLIYDGWSGDGQAEVSLQELNLAAGQHQVVIEYQSNFDLPGAADDLNLFTIRHE